MRISPLAAGASIVAAAACFLFLDQVEQAVSDLQRGGAVWDGKRVLAQETLPPRKVREERMFVFSTQKGNFLSTFWSW